MQCDRVTNHPYLEGCRSDTSQVRRDPMRFARGRLVLVAVLLLTARLAAAQTTTGTISGRVIDAQGLAIPGVTVTVVSPNLQGTRSVTTTALGDYIFSLLPSGDYK